MGRGLDQKTVKSAQRVLEMLDYFSAGRDEATVMNVARDLRYPQSSTSELLSCLVHLGYLRHERRRRTFHPTSRMAVLGHNVQRGLFRSGALLDMIGGLHAECGIPAVLAMQHGNGMQWVHIAGAAAPMSLLPTPSLLHSALGRVLLADRDDVSIRQLVHRLNAEASEADVVRPAHFLDEIEHVRRRGFDVSSGGEAFSGRIIGIAMPDGGEDQLAVGLAVDADISDSRIQDLVAHLRGRIGGSITGNMFGGSADARRNGTTLAG